MDTKDSTGRHPRTLSMATQTDPFITPIITTECLDSDSTSTHHKAYRNHRYYSTSSSESPISFGGDSRLHCGISGEEGDIEDEGESEANLEEEEVQSDTKDLVKVANGSQVEGEADQDLLVGGATVRWSCAWELCCAWLAGWLSCMQRGSILLKFSFKSWLDLCLTLAFNLGLCKLGAWDYQVDWVGCIKKKVFWWLLLVLCLICASYRLLIYVDMGILQCMPGCFGCMKMVCLMLVYVIIASSWLFNLTWPERKCMNSITNLQLTLLNA